MFHQEKIRLCFVGNPNVGKSTLINRILQNNNLETDTKPGTTKDINETNFVWNKKKLIFIDTAGVYRKKNVNFQILIKAIKTSDIILLILDANIEKLDKLHKRLVNYSLSDGKGIIVIFNKWDLIKNKKKCKNKLLSFIKFSLNKINSKKIIFISALKDMNFNKILQFSWEIKKNFNKKIQTSKLNKWLNQTIRFNPPSKIRGKELKFKYITQIKQFPPTFSIFSNFPNMVSLTYKRYLEKKLKLNFCLDNVPVFIKFFATQNPYQNKKK